VGRVKQQTRRYHSPLRADQADRTRQAVLDAALELFAAQGYAGTTVAELADRAGVSPQTIYQSLGGKRGLLEALIQAAIAGDPTPDAARWEVVERTRDARRRLRMMVEYSCAVLARTLPIHAVIRGASDKEVFAATLGRRLLDERLISQTDRVRSYLGGDLKPGLSVEEAGQRYSALASPDLYHLLVVELGWSADSHRAWLTELLETDLLGARPPSR
jgi:AcrR family transcriptional regulator